MINRRIYTSGKSQVLSVPPEWAKKIMSDTKGEILMRTYGNLLLISPFREREKHDEITIDASNAQIALCNLTSYYLIGKNKVHLVTKPGDMSLDNELEELKTQMYGMDFVRHSDKEIIVSFNPPDEPVRTLVDREFNLYSQMQKEAMHQLEVFPQLEKNLSTTEKKMDDYERSVDRTSYQTRRALITALYDPEVLLKLDLEHPADILGYYRIEENIERLADLQHQIFKEIISLKKIYDKKKFDFDLNPIKRFYMTAHDLSMKSFTEYGSQEAVSFVIRSKTGPARGDHIKTAYTEHTELVDRIIKESEKLVPESSSKDTMYANILKSLWHLESRINGMVGNASNISESWFFMLARQ